MTLFRSGSRRREQRNAWDSIAQLIDRGRRTYAGVPVDDDQAMRLGAVWGCVDLLAELVSTLPVDEYRRTNGVSQATSSRFIEDPAGDGTGSEVWLRQFMTSELLRGNTFGFVTSIDESMWPSAIELLHPDRVTLRRNLQQGPVTWLLDGKEIDRWPAGPLWHVPAYCVAGSPAGMSPITYAAQTIGVGLAAQKFGAQWFGDGAHPTATLESDQYIGEDDAKLLKTRIMAALDGGRAPIVLGQGTKLNPIQVSPEESQFLETMKANADDIARFFFRRPPGEGGEITYANVEARSIDLLTYTLSGWLVRIERALSRIRPRGRYVKFNADALLRVDTKTRYEAHTMAIRSGMASPDERRSLEDQPPIPSGAGAQYLWPPYATKSDTEGDADAPPDTP